MTEQADLPTQLQRGKPPAHGVHRPPKLLWLAAIGALVGGFVLFAFFVTERAPFRWDRAIMLGLRHADDPGIPVGPGWLRHAMVDVTALGSGTVLTMIVVGVVILLLLQRLWLTAGLTAIATLSGSLLAAQLKHIVGRARPDIVPHLVPASGLSFPSGHATNSAIVYLTMAFLLSQIERGRLVRDYTLAIAIFLTGAIGTSRVFLGVHWPSDVLAGWVIGTAWALLWWWIGARLRAWSGSTGASTRAG